MLPYFSTTYVLGFSSVFGGSVSPSSTSHKQRASLFLSLAKIIHTSTSHRTLFFPSSRSCAKTQLRDREATRRSRGIFVGRALIDSPLARRSYFQLQTFFHETRWHVAHAVATFIIRARMRIHTRVCRTPASCAPYVSCIVPSSPLSGGTCQDSIRAIIDRMEAFS